MGVGGSARMLLGGDYNSHIQRTLGGIDENYIKKRLIVHRRRLGGGFAAGWCWLGSRLTTGCDVALAFLGINSSLFRGLGPFIDDWLRRKVVWTRNGTFERLGVVLRLGLLLVFADTEYSFERRHYRG